jgi:hypothetical protein
MQRGGTLEPVQRTPPFKYTENEARKTWTRMVYPYAPYFFNLVKEIPWETFRFENEKFTVRCNKYTPYMIIGGSAFELLNKEYATQIGKNRLHAYADPTGDMDIMLPQLIYTQKVRDDNIDIDEISYVSSRTHTWTDYGDAYTRWLTSSVADYFRKLAPYFNEWFPNQVDWSINEEYESKYTSQENRRSEGNERAIHQVGPFGIYRFFEPIENIPEGYRVAPSKIQVSMNYYYEEDGKRHVAQEHLIEFLLSWDTETMKTEKDERSYRVRVLPRLGFILADPVTELKYNMTAMKLRVDLAGSKYAHKTINHITRALFFIKNIDKPDLFTSDNERQNIEYQYGRGILGLLSMLNSDNPTIQALSHFIITVAGDLLRYCPIKWRGSTPYSRPIFIHICYTLGVSIDKCPLADPPAGGGSRRAIKSTWGGRGGFYPSIMYGVSTAGPYFMTAAFMQGRRLIQNDRSRMTSRGQRTWSRPGSRGQGGRKGRRRTRRR